MPWVPGPYELTVNFENSAAFEGPSPKLLMQPGEQQFWRVLNATLQDFMPLQLTYNGLPQTMQLIALDGYPLAQPRNETTILIPPAGRAEFIVTAPPRDSIAYLQTLTYSTGPTGNPDTGQPLVQILLNPGGDKSASSKTAPAVKTADVKMVAAKMPVDARAVEAKAPADPKSSDHQKTEHPNTNRTGWDHMKFADLRSAAPTAERKLYFSEEFGGTNGPIQFYITVDGQKQQVFNPNEKPAITTKVGSVEDWTIENRALETHDFHIHQIHFMVLEVNGQPVTDQDMRDTIEIPYWKGSGPYPSVKVRMDFRDPTISGTFVFHCHILLHEDLGMMHKIQVTP